MKYFTLLIQFSSAPEIHYVVNSKHTRCGISLNGNQIVLHYKKNDHSKICPKCQLKNIPRLKEWNRERRITSAHYAKETLHMLSLLHEIIGEDLGIYWGLYEFNIDGCNSLTNYLMNDQPRIEYADEEKSELGISYRKGEKRQYRTISFNKIAEFYHLIKGDVFEELQKPRFLN